MSSIIPRFAVGDKLPLFFAVGDAQKIAALLGNLNAIVFDYFVRQKMAGTSLKQHYFKQFPVLPPSSFAEMDLGFIVPRVLELTYTSYSVTSFARDLGHNGGPFRWNQDRRDQVRAELDAWYARAYGLARDELRYILDPADVTSGAG